MHAYYLFVYLFIYLFICLLIYLFIYLFIFYKWMVSNWYLLKHFLMLFSDKQMFFFLFYNYALRITLLVCQFPLTIIAMIMVIVTWLTDKSTLKLISSQDHSQSLLSSLSPNTPRASFELVISLNSSFVD